MYKIVQQGVLIACLVVVCIHLVAVVSGQAVTGAYPDIPRTVLYDGLNLTMREAQTAPDVTKRNGSLRTNTCQCKQQNVSKAAYHATKLSNKNHLSKKFHTN